MKKLVVILAALMVIASTGCGSSSTKTPLLTYVARPTSTYNPQVFTLDPTTQKSTAVNIPVPANAMNVSANSDASLLVYTHADTGVQGTDVYIMGTSGTETQLTTGADASSPVFSPDGKTIAYYGVPSGGGDWQVFTMNADGSNQTALYAPPAGTLAQYVPTFSPDGKSLVFYIYVYSAPGAATSHSHPTAQGQSLPRPTGSGKAAARGVHSQVTTISQSGWYTMALTDTTPTLVYAPNDWWGPAVYSTDGTKLLFTDYDGTDWNIFSVNLDGTGVTELTTETTTESLAPVPYNGAILFNRWNSTNSSYDIYVMDPTGANQLLVNSTASTYEFLTDSYWSNE